jgi:hypothetical protein
MFRIFFIFFDFFKFTHLLIVGAYCLTSQNLCYNLTGASTTSNDPCVGAASGALVGPPTNEELCTGSAVAKDGICMCP